jgi:hypothetical protein
VEDRALQKMYYEQAERRMLLASFTSGLTGTPGRQVSYVMLKSVGEALKIAITENEAELQECRNDPFFKTRQHGDAVRQVGRSTDVAGELTGRCNLSTPYRVASSGKIKRNPLGTIVPVMIGNVKSAAEKVILLANTLPAEIY